jgi:hypothetical protein
MFYVINNGDTISVDNIDGFNICHKCGLPILGNDVNHSSIEDCIKAIELEIRLKIELLESLRVERGTVKGG